LTMSGGVSTPAVSFRTLGARSSLPTLSCWYCGANSSHPADGTACLPNPSLCLSLSGPEILLPAARGWPRPSAHFCLGSGRRSGDRPNPARDQFLALGVVGAFPRTRWTRPESSLWG
jgi:hypothetical protein